MTPVARTWPCWYHEPGRLGLSLECQGPKYLGLPSRRHREEAGLEQSVEGLNQTPWFGRWRSQVRLKPVQHSARLWSLLFTSCFTRAHFLLSKLSVGDEQFSWKMIFIFAAQMMRVLEWLSEDLKGVQLLWCVSSLLSVWSLAKMMQILVRAAVVDLPTLKLLFSFGSFVWLVTGYSFNNF